MVISYIIYMLKLHDDFAGGPSVVKLKDTFLLVFFTEIIF